MHGVVEEMERRGKGESAAISSAIDMGESETVGHFPFLFFFWPSLLLSVGSMAACKHVTVAALLHRLLLDFNLITGENKSKKLLR